MAEYPKVIFKPDSLSYPSEGTPGETVEIGFVFKEVNGVSGTAWLKFSDVEGYMIAVPVTWSVSAYEESPLKWTFTMPSVDVWHIRIDIGHLEGSSYIRDDYADIIIKSAAAVPYHNLTLAVYSEDGSGLWFDYTVDGESGRCYERCTDTFPEGSYTVSVSSGGYDPQSKTVVLNIDKTVTFYLKKTYVPPLYPSVKITNLRYPVKARHSEDIDISADVVEANGVSGMCWYDLVNRDTGENVYTPVTFYLGANLTNSIGLGVYMPFQDVWRLRFRVGHLEDSEYVVDDYRDFEIGLTVIYTVSISVDKSSVTVGDAVVITGRLQKDSVSVSGEKVELYVDGGKIDETYTSPVTGSYTFRWLPSDSGLFTAYVYSPTYNVKSDTVAIDVSPLPTGCTEGDTKCVGYDLYKCINGKWTLTEKNSSECGYTPPSVKKAGIPLLTGVLLAIPIISKRFKKRRE